MISRRTTVTTATTALLTLSAKIQKFNVSQRPQTADPLGNIR
jgi:hypothetical protein